MKHARVRKILAIKLRSLGDTVLMTAPLMELRNAFPEAEIHVAVTKAWAPLLDKHLAVDRVWAYERHNDVLSRTKAITRLALNLRKEGFDCVVNFHASPSSSTLAFGIGSKIRAIHFHGHKDKNRYSTVEIPGKGILKPIIERDMDTVRALGLEIPAGRLPVLCPQPGELNLAHEKLLKLGLHHPILAIGLGASRPSKNWGAGNFAKLASKWRQETDGSVITFTGRGEDDLLGGFRGQLSVTEHIYSEVNPPIRELMALLNRCSVFVGNDSGPKHVSVAVRTPTVTLFGPEHPFEWHPYPTSTDPYFFIENLPCRRDADSGMPDWCGLHECDQDKDNKHKCMRSIEVDQVFAECKRVMKA